MIRNAIAFPVAPLWAPEAERMQRCAFSPCGANDPMSRGFVPPREGADLVLSVGRLKLVCLQTETKLLPASVVAMEVKHRADCLEDQQGFRPGRKQLRELKERATADLLPRAFVRQQRTFAWVDLDTAMLFIDAASHARAEDLIEGLRIAHDELPIRRLDTVTSPSSGMLSWLADGCAPEGFTVDRDLELRATDEERATVRYTRHPLEGEDVAAHIAAGKRAVKMALTHEDSLSFVLTDLGDMRRIRALDVLREQLGEPEDAAEEFDATFLLEATAVAKASAALVAALGGEHNALKEAA